MPYCLKIVCLFLTLVLFPAFARLSAAGETVKVQVHWDKVGRVLRTKPTLLAGAAPDLWRGAPLHDQIFSAIKDLGVDDLRYASGGPFVHLGVAELEPPSATKTSWDFSYVDPITEDMMKATEGHTVAWTFAVIPQWMFKTPEPVRYPADPKEAFWKYEQGTELRDPTGKEVGDYFGRLVAWYTKGGFTDELGKWHESGHHYKIPYWEVLNEPDLEHGLSPQTYTTIYDAVVEGIREVSPQTKFIGLSDSYPGGHTEMFRYFLDHKNHKAGIPLDVISYHFYAVPNADEPPEVWQYTFFNQADRFLEVTGYIETLKKILSPQTGTMVNEIGTMLPDDWQQTDPGYVFKPVRPSYWNLSAAVYAYVFAGLTRLGIEAAGESGIPAYPGMWATIAMLDWETGRPNARFRVLKLIHEHFRPGDKLVDSSSDSGAVMAQAFLSSQGERKLLLVNKRDREFEINMPEAAGGKVETIDETTGANPPGVSSFRGSTFRLGPFGVAVVTLAK